MIQISRCGFHTQISESDTLLFQNAYNRVRYGR